MPFDYAKLTGLIVEKYGTRGQFAKSLGVSERTLSLKLNDRVPFTQPEILRASKLLSISPKDLNEYFFTLKVQ